MSANGGSNNKGNNGSNDDDNDCDSKHSGALQVFQTACRQGHFRLTVHSSSESGTVDFGMHAFTVGAAVISLMRWLSELRERLPKDGPAMLRQQVCMTVNKGKPSREGAYPDIKAAISSLLQGCHSPFRSVRSTAGREFKPHVPAYGPGPMPLCL